MAAKKLGTWSTCEDVAKALADGAKDVATKTVIVTGASAGIGKEAAFQLAKLGAHVVMGCRNVEKGEKVVQELQTRGGGKLEMTCMKLDVSDLESVKAFAESFLADSQEHGWKPLTCLVLNAGIFPSTAGKSKQDLELTFATNHLGHFLLTQLLLPTLRENKPSRVVVVSSLSHYGPLTLGKKHLESEQALKEKLATPGYKSMGLFRAAKVYGDSKLCNVLFTKELHEREKDNGVTAACLHPGTLITTDIARDTPGCFKFMFQYVISHFTKNVNQGAGTTLFLSLCPAEEMKGLYFDACKPKKESKLATPTACATLWGLSTTLCQGFLPSSN